MASSSICPLDGQMDEHVYIHNAALQVPPKIPEHDKMSVCLLQEGRREERKKKERDCLKV
jgi:hypothetical protein